MAEKRPATIQRHLGTMVSMATVVSVERFATRTLWGRIPQACQSMVNPDAVMSNSDLDIRPTDFPAENITVYVETVICRFGIGASKGRSGVRRAV